MGCEDGERLQAQGCLSLLSGRGEERDSALEPPEGPRRRRGGSPPRASTQHPSLELPRSRHRRWRVPKAALTVPAPEAPGRLAFRTMVPQG